jgi:hypothetical protein
LLFICHNGKEIFLVDGEGCATEEAEKLENNFLLGSNYAHSND